MGHYIAPSFASGEKELPAVKTHARILDQCSDCRWPGVCSQDETCWDLERELSRAVESWRKGRHPAQRERPELAGRMFDGGRPAAAEAVAEAEPPEPAAPPGKRRTWTEESALVALQAFVEREGRTPQSADTRGNDALPSPLSAKKMFGSWGDFIVAGGYPRPRRGGPPHIVAARSEPVGDGVAEGVRPPVPAAAGSDDADESKETEHVLERDEQPVGELTRIDPHKWAMELQETIGLGEGVTVTFPAPLEEHQQALMDTLGVTVVIAGEPEIADPPPAQQQLVLNGSLEQGALKLAALAARVDEAVIVMRDVRAALREDLQLFAAGLDDLKNQTLEALRT